MAAAGTQSERQNVPTRLDQGVLKYSFVITACIIAVYSNTLFVPFIFDDQPNIVENSSIRDLSALFQVFAPPSGTGIAGRPIINFSLALNFAISGLNPWSYHLLNLIIHLSAALCLFGILRRSFQSDRLKEKYGDSATPLAFACAWLWALHPLQTQAITYTIQRCESLMGLCFLLTFYFAIRGWQSVVPRSWHLAAVLSFLMGVGTKEVIVAAPVLLFIYDLLFFHGRPRSALRNSPLLYAGLSIGLVSLGLLVAAGGTASSGTGRMTFSPVDYWLTQPEVILHYLRLFFWPDSLSIDYGWSVTKLADAWLYVGILVMLMIPSLWALGKGQLLGFPAVWFFLILAPTSLLPLPDIAFEHRMYLPSIAIVVVTVIGAYGLLPGMTDQRSKSNAWDHLLLRYRSFCLLIITALALGITTYVRNLDYQSDASIWEDAAQKYPENSRAHANLGNALLQKGELRTAVEQLYEALYNEMRNAKRYAGGAKYYQYLSYRSVYAKVQDNLAWVWLQRGNASAAISHLQEALKVDSSYATAMAHMGIALYLQGKQAEAMAYFQKAIRLKPYDPDIQVNLGVTLRLQGKLSESMIHFQEALHLMPQNVEAHYGMGMALQQLGREAEAVQYFRETLKLDPHFVPAKEIMEQIIK